MRLNFRKIQSGHIWIALGVVAVAITAVTPNEYWLVKIISTPLSVFGASYGTYLLKKEKSEEKVFIDIKRKYEDFDNWLSDKLKENINEKIQIKQKSASEGWSDSTSYLDAQGKRVKKYLQEINNEWINKIERPVEDYCVDYKRNSIDESPFLTQQDLEKFSQSKEKKDKAKKVLKEEIEKEINSSRVLKESPETIRNQFLTNIKQLLNL